jgi:2-polyprenyl-3-methyl-5-hydroxy-6-metoxy-1,4-benzoquinol methylase
MTASTLLTPERMAAEWRSFRQAEKHLLAAFAHNSWFTRTYWPENRPRVKAMVRAVRAAYPTPVPVLDVGCFSGYIAILFSALGYPVTALDDAVPDGTEPMLAEHGIPFVRANLNEPQSLRAVPSGSVGIVLFGEVVEHLLNHPAGVLQELHRVLAPNGLLVLTTPNPSTLMNAVRVVRNEPIAWGMREFFEIPKVERDGSLTAFEGIHYREYPAEFMVEQMRRLGFARIDLEFVPPGPAPSQPLPKRIAKRVLQVTGLDRTRLLCPGYLLTARKGA